jgi:hypothetical protein
MEHSFSSLLCDQVGSVSWALPLSMSNKVLGATADSRVLPRPVAMGENRKLAIFQMIQVWLGL